MRILYVLNSGQPGGMEHHVLDLVNEMISRDHNVYVWCPEGPLNAQFQQAGAQVTTLSIKMECDIPYISKLITFLRSEKIDVIHAHEIKAVANSMLAGYLAGTKVRISHTHTPISEWKVPIYKKLPNLLVQSAVVNFFSSKEIALTRSRKIVKVKEWLLEHKLVVIPNGIKVEEFEISDEQKTKFRSEICVKHKIPLDAYIFGNIGRISEEKGHKILIDAFNTLQKSMPNAFLLLAGGGPLEAAIKESIKTYGLENKVVVTGRFDAEDHHKYFHTLDCFVHPTLAEGFGIVTLEAMSSNVPLLVSDLDVLQEVCADSVIYFETGNSADLAEKMAWIVANQKNTEILVKRANLRVKELYTLKNFGNAYEKLYSECLNQ